MTRLHAYITAAALLAALAPAAAAQERARDRDRVRDRDRDDGARVDTTFSFAAGGSGEISLPPGDVIVRAWSEPRVRVRGVSERGRFRVSVGAGYFAVELQDAQGRGSDARVEVSVPVGTRIRAHSMSGDVTVAGTRAEVEAHTQSGDMELDDVGRVRVGMLSGDLLLRRVRGDVQVGLVSGDVDVQEASGDLEIGTVSGDVTLRGVTSKRVRAKSTSGDVSYEGTIDAAGRYDFGSHAGDVDVLMPPGAGAQVTVSTFSGTIESDFPITLGPGQHALGVTGTKRFTFDVGRGDARVSAESFSGDVSIRQRGRARASDR